MSQKRRSPGAPARTTPTTTQLSTNRNPETRQQIQRRRAAAQRLPFMGCGCSDPWVHRCRYDGHPTPARVAGYIATVQLLGDLGYPAAPLLPELRAMWQQGDRSLVASVTTRWAVA